MGNGVTARWLTCSAITLFPGHASRAAAAGAIWWSACSVPGGAACTKCGYEQIYNLNGKLPVSGMSIDADGRARENREGRLFIGKLKSSMHPKQFRPVYGR